MADLEYILGYGLAGDFGRFRSAAPLSLARGERAVIRTERGLEIGQVLRPARPRHAVFLPNTTVGQLLRPVNPEDEELARQMGARADEILAEGAALIETLGLPLSLLDAEVLLDSERALLHYLHWDECDIREWVSRMSRRFEIHVALIDRTAPVAAEDHGCGSCGSEGGCGSCGSGGGCGSCSSAKPEEVQSYFTGLREQMEKRRVALL
jgi:cell fate regulator YaaT (PSP1 superfamily)